MDLGRGCLLGLLLVLSGCNDSGGRRGDGGADRGTPDAPFVKLDQLPIWTDLIGRDAYAPDTAPDFSVPSTLVAPFFVDFETDNGQLGGTRDWEWGQLSFSAGANCDTTTYYPPTAAHSGTGMWGTKLNDCYSPLDNAKEACSNSDTEDDSVLTLMVQLPANLPNPRLTFWEWADYFLTFDWTEIRIDGVVVQQSCTGSLPAPPKWEKRSIDLKAYVGKTITVDFHFMASSVVNHAGWYIDDMAVNSD
jgi:hypothetical protein